MFIFKSHFPHIQQPDSMECGTTCLRMIALYYGKLYSAEYMRRLCAIGHKPYNFDINDIMWNIIFHYLGAWQNFRDRVSLFLSSFLLVKEFSTKESKGMKRSYRLLVDVFTDTGVQSYEHPFEVVAP